MLIFSFFSSSPFFHPASKNSVKNIVQKIAWMLPQEKLLIYTEWDLSFQEGLVEWLSFHT